MSWATVLWTNVRTSRGGLSIRRTCAGGVDCVEGRTSYLPDLVPQCVSLGVRVFHQQRSVDEVRGGRPYTSVTGTANKRRRLAGALRDLLAIRVGQLSSIRREIPVEPNRFREFRISVRTRKPTWYDLLYTHCAYTVLYKPGRYYFTITLSHVRRL